MERQTKHTKPALKNCGGYPESNQAYYANGEPEFLGDALRRFAEGPKGLPPARLEQAFLLDQGVLQSSGLEVESHALHEILIVSDYLRNDAFQSRDYLKYQYQASHTNAQDNHGMTAVHHAAATVLVIGSERRLQQNVAIIFSKRSLCG